MILKFENISIDAYKIEAVYKTAICGNDIDIFIYGRCHTLKFSTREKRDAIYENIIECMRISQSTTIRNGETGEVLVEY